VETNAAPDPNTAPVKKLFPLALYMLAPASAPETHRAITPAGSVLLGVVGNLSTTSSATANIFNATANRFDCIKTKGDFKRCSDGFVLNRWAVIAGAAAARIPAITPRLMAIISGFEFFNLM
jgi:hypothetical protein